MFLYVSSLHTFVMFKDICKWDLLPLNLDRISPLNPPFLGAILAHNGIESPIEDTPLENVVCF